MKAVVLRAAGTNCDLETAYALEKAGAPTDIVHMNSLYKRIIHLEDYQILVIPGGFSYGDDISAAVLWATELKYKLRKDVQKFVEEGKPVLGICNGFQVLVKAGLLPGFEGTLTKQEATLTNNDIGLYYDSWVYLKNETSSCIFTEDLSDILSLPVAHAEGKFIIDPQGLTKLIENQQIVFRYVDHQGLPKGFPYNPNGSIYNIAGICNREGNVFGLMPHPERFLSPYMHPYWTSKKEDLRKEPTGLHLFKKIVEYAKQRT